MSGQRVVCRQFLGNRPRGGRAQPLGFVDGRQLGPLIIPEKVLDKIRSQIPVGRLCRPDEIARVVHFLAADASAYITGQVWGVNGGLDM